MHWRRSRADPEGGAAIVDFVLVVVILVPLVLGVMQLALVLHVRNTLTAAASEAARRAAVADATPGVGERYARDQIRGALSARFARDVRARLARIEGAPAVEVTIRAEVPTLGLWGPDVELVVTGHAIRERP
ncbi:TadE/TadG family type IV pilus assembly protein [Nocardioides daejeonensis]|uniref:TadE/TadG family type IV pilus assembly protein n=1 Tax=Nocardioides daejeonensis TaxID=1046556 RepID=UPI000D74FFFF|nr:TadE/TadG family type IV pilus assembly protein [Nocardioides daejeonensis]